MTLDESMKDNDILAEEHGIKILFEKTLASYLEDAVVDYAESQYGGGFQINTPSIGEGCGCS